MNERTSQTTRAVLVIAAVLLCSPAYADSLLTVSYGGVVSVVKGLDEKECAQMRDKMLETPCTKSWEAENRLKSKSMTNWNNACTYAIQNYMIQRAECLK